MDAEYEPEISIEHTTMKELASARRFAALKEQTKWDPGTCPEQAEMLERVRFCSETQQQYESFHQNPDLSGALYVLTLLDKLDAAAPARQQPPPESETGWRHASVDDYGRAMREALEELAESDRAKVRRSRVAYDVAMQKTLAYMNEGFGDEGYQMTLADLEAHMRAIADDVRRGGLLPDPELP